jgi:hypothetical protein
MAKKDKKAKKDAEAKPADPLEALRGVVERAFHGSQGAAGDRSRDLFNDISTFATRMRASLDELKIVDEIRGLRADVADLRARLDKLEAERAAAPTGAKPRARSPRAASTSPRGASAARGASSSAAARPGRAARKPPATPPPPASGGAAPSPAPGKAGE